MSRVFRQLHLRGATLVVLSVLAAACSSTSPSTSTQSSIPGAPTSGPTSTSGADSTTPTSTGGTPTTGVEAATQDAVDWVIDFLNSTDPDSPAPDATDVESRFAPAFLTQVSAQQLIGLLPEITTGATGPWSAVSTEVRDNQASVQLTANGALGLTMQLQVGAEPPHLIDSLLFQPIDEAARVDSLEALEAAALEIGPGYRLGIFEIVDGECTVAHDDGVDEVMPIGSTFKLWILAELAHQIEAGEATWDEVFPVQNRYKASPDGEIFPMAEGTEVTLRRYAELMISISDNSATDHLLFRLGRERVEAAMAESGVADPSLNIPFLAAADLFVIKFSPDDPSSAQYRTADIQTRRELLDALEDRTVSWIAGPQQFPVANAEGVDVSQPRDHDVEWFATPADLCRTHVHLADLAGRPGLEPVAEVLSINDTAGMPFDRTVWTDLRYKGGSEQGLVAVAWWMQRADGRMFVLAGGIENPDAPINPATTVGLLQQAVDFIE